MIYLPAYIRDSGIFQLLLVDIQKGCELTGRV